MHENASLQLIYIYIYNPPFIYVLFSKFLQLNDCIQHYLKKIFVSTVQLCKHILDTMKHEQMTS